MSSSRYTGFPAYSQVFLKNYFLRSQHAECTNDFFPVTEPTLCPLTGSSGIPGSLDVTGGEYKTRERIHRGMADPRLLAIPAS